MWKNSEEQRARLSDCYNHLQVKAFVDIERQRDILMKESDDMDAKLSRNYEQELQILTTKAAGLKSTCEHIIRQCQQEAQVSNRHGQKKNQGIDLQASTTVQQ